MDSIPIFPFPDTSVNNSFIEEEFVSIKETARITIEMQYPLLGMKNSEKNCFLRKSAADRLYLAASMLPDGYKLKIYDAWRSFDLQQELYETYRNKIIHDFNLKNLTDSEKNAFISRFVSAPNKDKTAPPVHTTGGAVDLTITDKEGNELPMGTGFDAFTEKTDTAYFEKNDDIIIRNNRRLLYYTMIKAGFTNLPSEWWHYDYGDRFWAFYTNKPAVYKGAFQRNEIQQRY